MTEVMLTMIALSLGTIAVSATRSAEGSASTIVDIYPLYIAPGTRMLRAPHNNRQVLGKVVVDLRNGNI